MLGARDFLISDFVQKMFFFVDLLIFLPKKGFWTLQINKNVEIFKFVHKSYVEPHGRGYKQEANASQNGSPTIGR